MAHIGTRLFTWLSGKKVGEDAFGNVYYQARKAPSTGRRKRWVVYKGMPEASKVPAQWHGWLHYTHDAPMSDADAQKYDWQQTHVPNLTGTKYAYLPKGHILKGAKRAATAADYEPWKPE